MKNLKKIFLTLLLTGTGIGIGMGIGIETTSAETMCTMEYSMMVNEETGECVPANDGCEIDDLLNQGHRRDEQGVCERREDPSPQGEETRPEEGLPWDPREPWEGDLLPDPMPE